MRNIGLSISALLIALLGLIFIWQNSQSTPFSPLTTESRVPAKDSFSEETYLEAPRCVTASGDTVFVAESGTDEVRLFSLGGEYLGRIGRRGHGPGEFSSLRSLVVDSRASRLITIDNRLVSIFTTDGRFLDSFLNPGALSLDVLPDGQILICSPARMDVGSLSVFNLDGTLQRSFSTLSDLIPGDDAYRPLWSYSYATVHDNEIWEVYLSFNIMRVHSLDGTLLREFRLDDEHLIQMDRFNSDQAAKTGRSRNNPNQGFPTPTQMNQVLRSSGGYLWLLTSPTRYIKEKDPDYITQYFLYQIDGEGEIVSRYVCPKNTAKDFIILNTRDPFRAIIMNLSPESYLAWVSSY